jgi:hypothetical protein
VLASRDHELFKDCFGKMPKPAGETPTLPGTTPGLATRQIVRREHQALEPPAARQRLHDLRDIGRSDTTVKKMVGLDQNADAARTLVEAARFADTRAEFRQTPRRDLFLQRCPDFLGPARGARIFCVVIRAPVRADKKVALALRHVVKSPSAGRRSTRFGENYFE